MSAVMTIHYNTGKLKLVFIQVMRSQMITAATSVNQLRNGNDTKIFDPSNHWHWLQTKKRSWIFVPLCWHLCSLPSFPYRQEARLFFPSSITSHLVPISLCPLSELPAHYNSSVWGGRKSLEWSKPFISRGRFNLCSAGCSVSAWWYIVRSSLCEIVNAEELNLIFKVEFLPDISFFFSILKSWQKKQHVHLTSFSFHSLLTALDGAIHRTYNPRLSISPSCGHDY